MAIDLFHNVHKGIRYALFQSIVALGREDDGARATLRDALRFTAHHGENEDVLLVPFLRERAPAVAARMTSAHARIDDELRALQGDVESAPLGDLHARTCAFTARYLEHVAEEEDALDPAIRAACADDELAFFGKESVARTSFDDARMMLAFMLRAVTPDDAEGYLSKLPRALADAVRASLTSP